MEKVETYLGDIRSYLRSMSLSAVRSVAGRIFDTYEKAFVYDKLDGNAAQSVLEQATEVPQRTISDWLVNFTVVGLASPPDDLHKGYRALFTLKELGINISTLKKKIPKTSTQQEPNQVVTQLGS